MAQYWLMKSEPETFSWQDLQNCPLKTEPWNGVRNYQARNFMRQMRKGDQALFYHSNTAVPSVVGLVTIVREAYPDPTSWDPQSAYYDARTSPHMDRWVCVDVRAERTLQAVPLAWIRAHIATPFALTQKGSRLSVMPVPEDVFKEICQQGAST